MVDGLRRAATATVAALAVALLVTACAGGGTPSPSPTPDVVVPPRPTPAELSVPVTADVNGVAATLEVGPVVRDGDLAVLHLTMTGQDSERPVESAALGLAGLEPDAAKPNHIRLLDTQTSEVRLIAYDADGSRAAAASSAESAAGEPLTVTAVYASPSGSTTAVLLPTVGLVDRVAVVDAADAPEDLPALDEVLAGHDVTSDDLQAPVVTAEAPREPLGGGGEADGGDGGATAAPEPAGPVGTVDEGVTVTFPGVGDDPDREVHVAVDEVRRVDDVLVGTVRATLRSTVATSIEPLFAAGLTLLHDGERVLPLTHPAAGPDGQDTQYPLADLTLDRTLTPGEALRVTVVWPDVGAEEVTVDVPFAEGADGAGAAAAAWRVTGVQVHPGQPPA